MNMPFCRFCGMRVAADALFCGSCGKALTSASPEQTNLSGSSRPLPPFSQPFVQDQKGDEVEEERISPPPVPVPEPSTPASAPLVQGTPQVGSVPSVPSVVATVSSASTKVGMGVTLKALLAIFAVVVVVTGTTKIVPIILKGGNHPGNSTGTGSHPIVTRPVPPAQTSCPAAGTARAAVTAPLVLGKHQNVVYVDNEGTADAPTFSILKRYDVTTGQTSEIIRMPNTFIPSATVSTDRRWILFVAQGSGQSKIQMIRMDGQGLQTLYCASANHLLTPNTSDIEWSPDQKLVAFEEQDAIGSPPIYLLNIANGTVQKELQGDQFSGNDYGPHVWLDNTHIAILGESVNSTDIYELDTNNGANQPRNTLRPIFIPEAPTRCLDFDINPDHTEIFINECTMKIGGTVYTYNGPSSVSRLPKTGGTKLIIYNSSTLAVIAVRAITNTILFLLINGSGLWEMHTDGSGLKQINIPIATARVISSSDGKLYAVVGFTSNLSEKLFYFGSLNGSSPTKFTTISRNSDILGWTTM